MDTIRDILTRAQARTNMVGAGSFNKVYDLGSADPQLAPYLLRVRKYPCFDHENLQSTSNLTPPSSLLTGMQMGQPLLELHDPSGSKTLMDIVRREPGQSIDQRQRQAQQEAPSVRWLTAATEVMEQVLSPGDNPFLPLMQQCYRLRCHGFKPDIAAGNIMLRDDGRIGLIDQLQYDRANTDFFGRKLALLEVREKLATIFCKPSDAIESQLKQHDLPEGLRARYRDACEDIEDMLAQAVHATLTHYQDHENPPTPFTRVEQTSGIALSAPPKQLLEALRRVEAGIEAPKAAARA